MQESLYAFAPANMLREVFHDDRQPHHIFTGRPTACGNKCPGATQMERKRKALVYRPALVDRRGRYSRGLCRSRTHPSNRAIAVDSSLFFGLYTAFHIGSWKACPDPDWDDKAWRVACYTAIPAIVGPLHLRA